MKMNSNCNNGNGTGNTYEGPSILEVLFSPYRTKDRDLLVEDEEEEKRIVWAEGNKIACDNLLLMAK